MARITDFSSSRFFRTVVLFFIATPLPMPALAVLDGITVGFEYGYQRLDYDWREFTPDGTELLKEDGQLNRDYLAVITNFDDRLRLLFDAHITRGYVDYDGQTQSGVPHQSRSRQEEEAYRLGAQWPLPTRFGTFLPTLTYQYLDWQRRVLANNGISSIEMTYKWPRWGAGLAYHAPVYKGQLQLAVLREWSSQGNVDVDLTAAGLAETRLKLGDGDGYTATLRYEFPITETLRLVPQAGYHFWQWGASEQRQALSQIAYAVQEPESEAKMAFIGLAIQFFYE